MQDEKSDVTNNPSAPSQGSVKERSRKTIHRRLFWAALLAVACVGGLFYNSSLQASDTKNKQEAPARPPMPVETSEVRVMDSHRELSAVGTLQSQESVIIATELAGRIDKIAFTEGEQVEKGAVLIKLDSSTLQAEYDRALASLNLSKANFQRAENLLKDNAVSVKERDEAYAQWQLDEANLRLARARLDKTTIHAPFSGTLGLRQVSVGDYIQPGQPLVNLEAVERLKVEFRLPEKFSAEIKSGQQFELLSDAWPGRTFSGQVYAIDPQVEAESRSLVLRGLLDNQENALYPGQFVKVQLTIATRQNALFIPEQALLPQPKSVLVYKVVDNQAQMVPVETGQRLKGWVEVTEGLQPGDVVITGGHQKIGPGSPVQPLPADPALFSQI